MKLEPRTDTTLLKRPKILVVDDSSVIRLLLSSLLKVEYDVVLAKNGEEARSQAQSDPPPDLILMDVEMPGDNGFEVCRLLKADERTRTIPVVFLTSLSDAEYEGRGLKLGAVDYISKPVSPPIVMTRVANHLALRQHADFLRSKNEFLEAEVQRRTAEINAIQDVTIMALASMAETRDNETGNHIRRTQHYVKMLAEHLMVNHPRFATQLDPTYVNGLFKCAPLHDIGKVGMPDRILLKPGRLTTEEFEVMKTHTTLGRDAIERAEAQLGVKVEFLTIAKEIAYSHQEKWDGSGYPQGIKGINIPLSARLMAVADVYDALISARVYKAAMTHAEAVQILVDGSGTHFDPDIVDAFVAVKDGFEAIAARYGDSQIELSLKQKQIETTLAGFVRMGATL